MYEGVKVSFSAKDPKGFDSFILSPSIVEVVTNQSPVLSPSTEGFFTP